MNAATAYASVAVGGRGVKIEGIGKAVQAQDPFPRLIIEIGACFLFKAHTALFLFVGSKIEHRAAAKIVGDAFTFRPLSVGIGIGESGFCDHPEDSGVKHRFVYTEEEKADERGGQHPKGELPIGDLTVERILLMSCIIAERAQKPGE